MINDPFQQAVDISIQDNLAINERILHSKVHLSTQYTVHLTCIHFKKYNP